MAPFGNLKDRECTVCGTLIARTVYAGNSGKCHDCFRKYLRSLRKENKDTYYNDLKMEFKNPNCHFGICDSLAQHHAMLEDDPERLSTEFILGLIKGEDVADQYRENKVWKELLSTVDGKE